MPVEGVHQLPNHAPYGVGEKIPRYIYVDDEEWRRMEEVMHFTSVLL